ncbi:Uncharacterised protein [Mycobacteroides abscessus subsp. abscessus]|nr:Uncharacterised protein [Mycobacteroides abscessus subsp. abscessus]
MTKISALAVTAISTMGMSLPSTAFTMSLPTPRREKTVSVSTVPPTITPMVVPSAVTTGSAAARRACRTTRSKRLSPQLRAVSM